MVKERGQNNWRNYQSPQERKTPLILCSVPQVNQGFTLPSILLSKGMGNRSNKRKKLSVRNKGQSSTIGQIRRTKKVINYGKLSSIKKKTKYTYYFFKMSLNWFVFICLILSKWCFLMKITSALICCMFLRSAFGKLIYKNTLVIQEHHQV